MMLRLTFFLATFMTLAVVHVSAIKFFFYWKYLWLDIPVHLLGGVAVSLGISVLPLIRIRVYERFRTAVPYVLTALVVGGLWEIFEIVSGFSMPKDDGFVLDTALDLGMDMLGGLLGYGLVSVLKKF